MITSIELGNFLSHNETKIEFNNGVTVFVGDNGSGKSSIIDGITFALFGKHTRKLNKGLIKHGTSQGFSKVEFNVNETQYTAIRKIDKKGGLSAQFYENVNNELIEIAAGERKKYGESMTEEIEKKIGLSFEKLKIASIVQQGELNSIIKAKPKEFKELLNTIIGIDKLDTATEIMKIVIKDFREKIRKDIGFDDMDIERVSKDLETYQKELDESIPGKKRFEEEQKICKKELSELRQKVENDTTKLEKLNQLNLKREELRTYAKQAIQEIRQEIAENERKIRDCEGCFEHVLVKDELELKIGKTESSITNSQKRLHQLSRNSASLEEKLELAKKLQLKDNKCPVCDSIVDKLNPLFQQTHLKQELLMIEDQIDSIEKEQNMLIKKKDEYSKKLQKAGNAEAVLLAHSIKNQNELIEIQKDLEKQKINVKNNESLSQNITEMAHLDSHTKKIFEDILNLEKQTRGFQKDEFIRVKNQTEEKQIELSQIDQQIGSINQKIAKSKEMINLNQKAMIELEFTKKFIQELGDIQTNVFNRDGSVATSLRSWALNAISEKASEYLMQLNTEIQRILLTEKIRNVSITCYSKNNVLELESLSGGEQVSVALALRLGMANLLGASNLNLMILDEPTTHLDAEHKKSLVSVLSQLANITNGELPMQFIIITHDSEIFEDSSVEQIFKFESSDNGTVVTSI